MKLHLERYETASDSSEDEQGPAAALTRPEVLAVYESGGVTTTVTAIAMNSDRCHEADDAQYEIDEGGVRGGCGKAPSPPLLS